MAFWTKDSFTDTDNVLLENHTSDIGLGWTKVSGTGNKKILANELVHGSGDATYHTSSGDIDEFHFAEARQKTGTSQINMYARVIDNSNYYFSILSSSTGKIFLRKKIAGVTTSLAEWIIPGFSGSVYYKITLKMKTVKSIDLDDIERITSTDDLLTAGRKAGLETSGGDWAIDDFLLSDFHIADLLTVDGSVMVDMSANMIKLLTIIDGILSGDDAPGVDPGPYRLQIFVDSPMTRTIDVVSTLR